MKILATLLALGTLLLCVVLPQASYLPLAVPVISFSYGIFAALSRPNVPLKQRAALTFIGIAVVSMYIAISPDPTGLNSSLAVWFAAFAAAGFAGIRIYRLLRYQPQKNGPVA